MERERRKERGGGRERWRGGEREGEKRWIESWGVSSKGPGEWEKKRWRQS